MNRLISDKLDERDQRYFNKNELYTGVLFRKQSKLKVESFEVREGLIAIPYSPTYFQHVSMKAQIDATSLWYGNDDWSVDLHFNFDGNPYTGVAYAFNDEGNCDHEIAYRDGQWVVEAIWGKHQLKYLAINGDFIYESYEWSQNGQIRSVALECGQLAAAGFGYSEDGKLFNLSLKRGFLSKINELIESVWHCPVRCLQDFTRFSAARKITLSGDEIDDRLLVAMISANVFANTEEISCRDVRIGQSSIDALAKLVGLKKFEITSTFDGDVDLVNKIKMQRSDVEAVFGLESSGGVSRRVITS